MKFVIVVKQSTNIVAEIRGILDVDIEHLSMGDIQRITVMEAYLEKLTGLRFHIESEP